MPDVNLLTPLSGSTGFDPEIAQTPPDGGPSWIRNVTFKTYLPKQPYFVSGKSKPKVKFKLDFESTPRDAQSPALESSPKKDTASHDRLLNELEIGHQRRPEDNKVIVTKTAKRPRTGHKLTSQEESSVASENAQRGRKTESTIHDVRGDSPGGRDAKKKGKHQRRAEITDRNFGHPDSKMAPSPSHLYSRNSTGLKKSSAIEHRASSMLRSTSEQSIFEVEQIKSGRIIRPPFFFCSTTEKTKSSYYVRSMDSLSKSTKGNASKTPEKKMGDFEQASAKGTLIHRRDHRTEVHIAEPVHSGNLIKSSSGRDKQSNENLLFGAKRIHGSNETNLSFKLTTKCGPAEEHVDAAAVQRPACNDTYGSSNFQPNRAPGITPTNHAKDAMPSKPTTSGISSLDTGFGIDIGGGFAGASNRSDHFPAALAVGRGDQISASSDVQANAPMLISGGRVVNGDSICLSDVYIEGGVIKQVGHNLQVPHGCKIIDAKGKYVMPGGIDPHVHFNLPMFNANSVDDFYTGTKAAVTGGTTTIIDFVMPSINESLLSAYEKYRAWADPNVCCDYGLSVIVRNVNEKVKNEMQELVRTKGINSFKFFMAYSGVLQVNDQDFYQGLVQCRKIGALARVHAENGDLICMKEKELLDQGIIGPEGHLQARPEGCQSEATARACLLAKEANCPLYVVHVMSKGAADAIGDARRKGAVIFGEAVASGLSGVSGAALYHSCWNHAAAHVMSPPLSDDPSTASHLMDSLAAGQLQTTGSDHAVFDSNQKAAGKNDFTKIPNGVNGVEERMMVIWEKGVNTGKVDPMRFVAITSSIAAKLFNIYPKKGRIAPESDADIVIWDPDAQRIISAQNHVSKGDFNIFEGITCTGCPHLTISRGQIVFENNQLKTNKGVGKFIPMVPFAPHVYASVSQREKSRQPIKIDRKSNGTMPKTRQQSGGHSNNYSHHPSSHSKNPNAASMTSTPTSTPSVTSPSSTANSFDDIPVGGKFSSMHISQQDFHGRPSTKAGGRNLQDSSFNLSGFTVSLSTMIPVTGENASVTTFRKYLRINTMHPDPNYDVAVNFLQNLAIEVGLLCHVLTVAPRRPVITMTWPGQNENLPSILLNSHMDVVPVFPEYWKYDPFAAHKDEEGNIYGRGAQDMKCVGIQYVEAIRRLKSQNVKLLRTIHLVFVPGSKISGFINREIQGDLSSTACLVSPPLFPGNNFSKFYVRTVFARKYPRRVKLLYLRKYHFQDEEIGGSLGMNLFVETEEFKKLNVGFALDEGLASPTPIYYVYNAERAKWWLKVTCRGETGHGSRLIENTAAEKFQKILNRFMAFREENVMKLKDDPPSDLGNVFTVNLTMISGGVQVNVIPSDLIAHFDIRVPPTENPQEYKLLFETFVSEVGVDNEVEWCQFWDSPNITKIDESNKWWKIFSDTLKALNLPFDVKTFIGGTDGRFLRRLNIPVIGFSPMNNTPTLLHEHNEYLNEKVYLRGVDIYVDLIRSLGNNKAD